MTGAEIIARYREARARLNGQISKPRVKVVEPEPEPEPVEVVPEADPALIVNSESIDFKRGFTRAVAAVASHYRLLVSDLKSSRRNGPIARARFVAFYILREDFEMSFPQIGHVFRRDHTTVINGYYRTVERMGTDEQLGVDIATIRSKLNDRGGH